MFDHHLIWVPWQRPGFELAMMLRRAVQENPGCDGVVLGGHGLFTWGNTQRECYVNTITIIDQLGQFIVQPRREERAQIRSAAPRPRRWTTVPTCLEFSRFFAVGFAGSIAVIGSFSDLPEVLRFVNSAEAEELAYLGTSCPDHFIRTKIRPMFVPWQPGCECAGTARAD